MATRLCLRRHLIEPSNIDRLAKTIFVRPNDNRITTRSKYKLT